MVKQYRYPTHKGKSDGFIYEAVAGKIDDGEEPIQSFIREVEEEAGYKIKEKNVTYCNWCYMSPGYSTDRIHLFLATVTKKDKKNKGGGKEGENEFIDVEEIPYLLFESLADSSIKDAKTKLLSFEARVRKFFQTI